jgi:hypothetical protein
MKKFLILTLTLTGVFLLGQEAAKCGVGAGYDGDARGEVPAIGRECSLIKLGTDWLLKTQCRWVMRRTRIRRQRWIKPLRSSRIPWPADMSPETLMVGQKYYETHCLLCHGTKGEGGEKVFDCCDDGSEATDPVV